MTVVYGVHSSSVQLLGGWTTEVTEETIGGLDGKVSAIAGLAPIFTVVSGEGGIFDEHCPPLQMTVILPLLVGTGALVAGGAAV